MLDLLAIIVSNSTVEPIPNLPRCIRGPGLTDCYTIGYTPSNDANALEVIQRIQAANGIPDNEVISFKTEAEGNQYLAAHPNTTQAVVHFIFDYGCDPSQLNLRFINFSAIPFPLLPSVILPYLDVGSDSCHARTNAKDSIRGVRYLLQYNRTVNYVRGRAVNPVTYVQLPLQRAVDRALIATFGSNVTFDYDLYPFAHPELILSSIVSSVGRFFFFGALMFNFVVQISNIAVEKELHLRESMRVMGLLDFAYWLSWLIVNLVMNIISAMLLILAGVIFRFEFFLKNDFLAYFYLFVLFSIAMVPLAFLVSTLLDKTSTATTLGFAVFLIGVMIQSFTNLIYQDTTDLVWRIIFSFLPFALLAKGLGDLGSYTDSSLKLGLRFNDIGTYGFFPLTEVYWWLAIDFGFYLIIALYLDNVLYSRRKLWFFLQPSYWTGATTRPPMKEEDEEQFTVEDVDEDVKAEEDYIKSNTMNENDAVIIENLVKTYQSKILGCIPGGGKPFRAVKGVFLTIQKGSLLCLLGHNGAGKTTTIKMLTGLFGQTSGDATVFGHSIIDGMNEIRQVMGVCPQHDILWRQLTAREHLELFAGLKDLDPAKISGEVDERLQDVSLTAAADIPAGSYSGGMKRRLSVAIALIGDPKIVFLDEPTTGMDPVSRRGVWNLIERVKRGRVTLLTTHSMEEADILGDKIAIMKGGRIAALGTSLRLKNRFGSGYTVSVIAKEDSMKQVQDFVFDSFDATKALRSAEENGSSAHVREVDDADDAPKKKKKKPQKQDDAADATHAVASSGGVELVSQVQAVSTFKIPLNFASVLPDFFENLEGVKKKLGIKDFQLSMTTLEEVFLKVADEPVPTEKKKEKKKMSLKKKICIGVGVTVGILVLLLAITIGVGRARRLSQVASPAAAANRTSEPNPYFIDSTSLDTNYFAWNVLASDVTTDSALVSVWTAGYSLLSMHLYEAQGNSSWALKNQTDNLVPANNATLQLELTGLQADTPYTVFFSSGGLSSNPTRFRTATSASGTSRRITFGATSSLGRTNAPWAALGQAAKQNFDFFLLLGDSIYSNFSQTPGQFRAKWSEMLQTEGFKNLSRSTSFIATFNDQEIGVGTDLIPANLAGGRAAFSDVFPTRKVQAPALYRSIRYGNEVEIFVTDVRSERNSTQGRIMSQAQLDWLKAGLLNTVNPCKFKIVVTAVPFSNAAALSLPPQDSWSSFPVQRKDLLDTITNNTIRGVLFISGDYQFGAVSYVEPVPANADYQKMRLPWGTYNTTEISAGPSGTRINPYMVFNSRLAFASRQFPAVIDTWTYTRIQLEPVTGQVFIQFVDDLGNIIDDRTLELGLPACGAENSWPCKSL